MPHAHRFPVDFQACLAARSQAGAAVALSALLLAACGGGSDSSSTPAVASAASAASAAAVTPVSTVAAQLSGVAAFGAPLAGATLKVIDAKGVAVGSGVTNQADGSYSLTLNTATPALPLLLQAAGFDATGQPLLLHSAIATLPVMTNSSAAAIVNNITPLTDAAVALTLGAEPRKVFAQPTTYATALAALAKLGPASDFVKTLVKTNLTDAKVTNTTTLDLFADSAFAATKVGVDLALETLSVSYGSSALRRDQLQLSNKLGSRLAEVTVDLATAATELAKTTGAVPANAITSTLKSTTSPTALVTRLPALDTLAVAINTAVAAGGSGSAVTALTTNYVRHNGRDADALTALIATWAQQGTQLGRLQVTGCADLPSTSTTTTTTTTVACTKVAVAARLTDTTGRETGSFGDVVTYSTSTSRWSLVGNGLPALVTARAVGWLSLNAEGAKLTGQTANPRIGIQLGVQNNAVDSGVNKATVLTPSNYVLSLVPCEQTWLCISPTAGAGSTVASATPADQSVFQGTSAWMGVADTAVGATYGFTLTPTSGGSNITLPVALRNGFLDAPADVRFPVLDGVKAAAPLSGATLLFGTTLAWQTWAAANPDMRLTTVRLVLGSTDSGVAPLVFDTRPARWQAGSLEWAAVAVPDDFALGGITLWLLAIDASGREYATGYVIVAAP